MERHSHGMRGLLSVVWKPSCPGFCPGCARISELMFDGTSVCASEETDVQSIGMVAGAVTGIVAGALLIFLLIWLLGCCKSPQSRRSGNLVDQFSIHFSSTANLPISVEP